MHLLKYLLDLNDVVSCKANSAIIHSQMNNSENQKSETYKNRISLLPLGFIGANLIE